MGKWYLGRLMLELSREWSFLLESTADRIKTARREQLAARAARDSKSERVWTEAIHRLLDLYAQEMEHFQNAND